MRPFPAAMDSGPRTFRARFRVGPALLAAVSGAVLFLSIGLAKGGHATADSDGAALQRSVHVPDPIRRVLEEEAQGLEALQSRLRAASSESEALAVERALEKLKVETELRLLQVQADLARADGRLELAQDLEGAILDILHPRVPLAPSQPSRADDAPKQ